MIGAALIDQLNTRQVRALALQMQQALRAKDELLQTQQRQLVFKQATIDKLTHEMAVLKRLKFAATSERFASTLSPEQRSLLEETLDTDIHELDGELQQLATVAHEVAIGLGQQPLGLLSRRIQPHAAGGRLQRAAMLQLHHGLGAGAGPLALRAGLGGEQ